MFRHVQLCHFDWTLTKVVCVLHQMSMYYRPSFPRSVEEVWQAGVPGSGQCREDHPTAHAEGRQNGTAYSNTACKYVQPNTVSQGCLVECA